MSQWDSKTVSEIVQEIIDDGYVLPVIQRRLVWVPDQMTLLFDSVMKGNAFGGIMVLLEEKNDKPLFESRKFSAEGTIVKSTERPKQLDRNRRFVIDGQQRLQSFYIGLKGSFEQKVLYLDLASDVLKGDYDFRFAAEHSKLPTTSTEEDDTQRATYWYPVPSLYQRLKDVNEAFPVADEIISILASEGTIPDETMATIRKTISRFYETVLKDRSVGICQVQLSRNQAEANRRQRVVELFRRLNEGGTKLSAYDLIAARLKGFDYKMESFLDSQAKYDSIGLGQDEIIKLLFILQDDWKREFADINESDARYIIDNRERIEAALEASEKFLNLCGMNEFFRASRRSSVPLYFLVYHIYHQTDDAEKLRNYFDKHDTKSVSTSSSALYRWLHYSLLSGVFKSKGAGWYPHRTGVAKILERVKDTKGKPFPTDEIFKLYREYPLTFFKDKEFVESDLDMFDKDFVLYLIYDRKSRVRQNDVDHIHPKSRLERQKDSLGIGPHDIDTIRNYQLLHWETNREEKKALPFKEWIENFVEDVKGYLPQHLIPTKNKEGLDLLDENNYQEFLRERSKLILAKILA